MDFYQVSEMMYGIPEKFTYMMCQQCGLLQICEKPEDMERYYFNKNYYSFQKPTTIMRLKKYAREKACANVLCQKNNLVGFLWLTIDMTLFARLAFMKEAPKKSVLDVGCGNGRLLDELSTCGYVDLYGIDLYIDDNMETRQGIKISKGTIHDINREFKLVMFHHSFEHMEDQFRILQKSRSLLYQDGFCVVRIPIKNTAWDLYHENWYQIDAPRHFYLHTEKSFRILAEQAGFEVDRVIYDSGEAQFIASELYMKGIALRKQSILTTVRKIGLKKILSYRKRARLLNLMQRGDQAIFVLRKV